MELFRWRYSIIVLYFGSEYGVRYFKLTPVYLIDTMVQWICIWNDNLKVTSSIQGIIFIKYNFFTLNNDHVVKSDPALAKFSLK